jgi:hypothetical protein
MTDDEYRATVVANLERIAVAVESVQSDVSSYLGAMQSDLSFVETHVRDLLGREG